MSLSVRSSLLLVSFVIIATFFLLFLPKALAVEFKFDFQPSGSPVQAGFIEINKDDLYALVPGYGWSSAVDNDGDRGGAYTDLERDFVYDNDDRMFNVNLPNGDYTVTVYLGDKGAFAHDDMYVDAEGGPWDLSDVDTAAGEVKILSFDITVSDGQLNILFRDNGGADVNWVSEGLEIKPKSLTVCASGCDFTSVQGAIDAATPGATIFVGAGTYDEQVVINKALTLEGVGDTTIIKPSSDSKLTQVFDGLFWYGTPNTKNIAGIIVANVPDGSAVAIKNLKVDESSVTTKPAGADYLTGIFYRETSGTTDNVNVDGGGKWAPDRAFGMYLSAATNIVSVEIKGSTITNFDKEGINAEGNTLTVNIHHNTITGRGPTLSGDEVQNGVDVGRDAVGTVNYNTISNLAYQPEQWWAAGIMFYSYVSPTGKSATAIGNTVTDCQIGIIFKNVNGVAQDNTVSGGTVGLIGIYAEPNAAGTWTASFTGNTVSDAKDDSYYHDENAAIGANTYQSVSPGATLTVTIDDNQLISASPTSADGISIGVGGATGSIVATITNNIISNWQYGIRLTGALVNAASSNANFNNIMGNFDHGIFNGGTGTLNAKYNWWGSSTGPTHSSNSGGTGDAVSDNVDFGFWLFSPFNPSDHTRPKVQTFSLSDSSPVNAGTLLFTITFDEDMDVSIIPEVRLTKGMKSYAVDANPSYTNGWSDIRTWNGRFVIDSSTGNGEYTLRIGKAKDINNNQMLTDSSNKILIDTVSPQFLEVFAPDIFGSQDLTVSASAYDPGSSGISKVTVAIDGDSQQNMIFAFSEEQRIGGKNVNVDTYFLTISGSIFTVPSHTATFKIIDGAGNEVASSSIPFNKNADVKTTGGTIAYLCKSDPTSETVKKFDFGTKSSPIQPGYTRVTEKTLYPTASSYGWVAAAFGSIDRGVGSKLERDLVYDSASKEFIINLPSDTYSVTILMGDMLYAHDDMSVNIEGTVVSNIDTNVGEIKVITREIVVSDGQLNVVFSDADGSDPNWVVNALEISSKPICLDGIEKQTINWLISKGWTVHFDKYNDWTLSDLLAHDLIVCSDEEKACRPTDAVLAAHKNNNKPFVEISDAISAKAAAGFDYLSNSGGSRAKSTTNVFIERADSITNNFFGSTQILTLPQKLTKITRSLSTNVKDVASADDSPKGSNLFKVDTSGSQGRFVYVGWLFGRITATRFTGWTPLDLNSNGQLLLQRAINWAQCGNPTGCI